MNHQLSAPAPAQYREQMLALVETWQQSGLSKKAFCAEQGISYHRLHYWYQRYKLQHAPATSDSPAFIHLDVHSTPPSTELIFPDGRRLLFHQGVDAAFLKALLA